jgi:hypothetical protein
LSTWKNGDQRVTNVIRVGVSRAEIFAEPPFALIWIIHSAHLDVRQITTTLSVCKDKRVNRHRKHTAHRRRVVATRGKIFN